MKMLVYQLYSTYYSPLGDIMIEHIILFIMKIHDNILIEFNMNKNKEELKMVHMHITAWVVGLILFFIASSMYKSGKMKPATIVHMILRLFYLIIIASGILVLNELGFNLSNLNGEYIGKIILGIVTVAMMEMVLVKMKKEKPAKVFWIIFIIALVLTILLGIRLPGGIFHM